MKIPRSVYQSIVQSGKTYSSDADWIKVVQEILSPWGMTIDDSQPCVYGPKGTTQIPVFTKCDKVQIGNIHLSWTHSKELQGFWHMTCALSI
jgi:hypothetical protein